MEKRLLLKAKLDIEPATWGADDARKRTAIRAALKRDINGFDEHYVWCLIEGHKELSLTRICYLTNPDIKDIDNLAKIPVDALFFSARNETGAKRNWESTITSLEINKIRSPDDRLEISLYGIEPQ